MLEKLDIDTDIPIVIGLGRNRILIILIDKKLYINNIDTKKRSCRYCKLANNNECSYKGMHKVMSLCLKLYYLGYKKDYSYEELNRDRSSLFLCSKIKYELVKL